MINFEGFLICLQYRILTANLCHIFQENILCLHLRTSVTFQINRLLLHIPCPFLPFLLCIDIFSQIVHIICVLAPPEEFPCLLHGPMQFCGKIKQ